MLFHKRSDPTKRLVDKLDEGIEMVNEAGYTKTQKHYHNVTQEALASILLSLDLIRLYLCILIGLQLFELFFKSQ